jgi:hypothetical protein
MMLEISEKMLRLTGPANAVDVKTESIVVKRAKCMVYKGDLGVEKGRVLVNTKMQKGGLEGSTGQN